ncbi:alpha-hydroxyketone-type quorum-sensing autoinducer synthase [Rhodococcus oryzae]|uniref:alpha-hydroxyketone-type quorum-sensing autoinducer synthase n=1 Tax=Rhodococcus oryzae TaxID=2571143 RepID=UPI0037232A7E
MDSSIGERIRNRVARFTHGRVGGEWGGRHLLHSRPSASGDMLLTSNDYLALARDSRITAAMTAALEGQGGPLASGVFVHGAHPQIRFEQKMADHMLAPAGILCQSGWDANAGLLQSIADADTPVYVDNIAHMSLWAGAKNAGAPVYPFRHNSPEKLRERIAERGPGIIAVDSIYSTNGSRCPLESMCDIADETGSVLVVDESHSLGTDGPDGAGMVVEFGLADRVHFRIASLSKAFAGRAGFVTAPNSDFAEYFKMESYPAVFSTTLLPHDIAGLSATLDIIRQDGWRRERLIEVSVRIRRELTALGFDLEDSDSQIVAVQTGPDLHTFAVRDFLEERGIFGSVFCPPATSRQRTLIRFSLHAALTDSDVDRIIEACTAVRDRFGAEAPKPGGLDESAQSIAN